MNIAMFGHKHIFTSEGGIEVVVSELAPRLTEGKDYVTSLDRWEVDKKRMDYPENKVDILQIPTLSKSSVNAQLYSLIASIFSALGDYDIVHIHAEGPAVFIPIIKLFGKPVVVTIHGLDWQRAKWGKFASAYIKLGENMLAKYADEIIVLNEETASYFRDCYGRRTTVIENGVSIHPTTDTDLIEPLGLAKGNYILYMGRFAAEKRLDLLVDAFLMSDTDKKLVIAGDPNGFENEKWFIKAKECEDIIFPGFVTGKLKEELLSNTALYVLPSDLEGLSISLLEGLGYGVRVLCSDIPENVRTIYDFGYTFKAGDVKDLSYRISSLTKLPFRRDREQFEYIKHTYDWDAVAKKTKAVYRRLLKEKE